MLTEDCLQNLYLNPGLNIRLPRLQLINFELSQLNPNQIILRLSDAKSFIDSPLSGPYKIKDGKIVSQEIYQPNKVFKRYDIVTIDYFCKIDKDKICHLQFIIRRIELISNNSGVIGSPQQISQYIENQNRDKNIYPFLSNQFNIPFKMQNSDRLGEIHWGGQNPLNVSIKSEKMSDISNSKKKSKLKGENQGSRPISQNFLDLHQIQNNKEGIFIGRLVRIKAGVRQSKEGGSITVLYLGLIDLNSNLVRISLIGKNAIRQQQHLVKYQVYTIKGVQNSSLDRSRFIYYLKLKDKEYTIKKIVQQPFASLLPRYWFHFDHQPSQFINITEENQLQVVDVIGVVDQIDNKITYKNIHSFQEERNVVRITVRNAHKSVKVSFWAQQIKILENCQLKKYDEVIMYDLKKKKNIFLDFTIESNLLNLKDQPQLRQMYKSLLPEIETLEEPQNIKELLEYFEVESNNSKVKHLNSVYLMKIYESKVFFKVCEECKKKIDKNDKKCPDCGCNLSHYKFNSLIDFVDYTGSIKCVSFDLTTEKILGKSANEVQKMTEDQLRTFFERFSYNLYEIGIEFKNDRYVLRSIEPLNKTVETTWKNIKCIEQIRKDKDFIHFM